MSRPQPAAGRLRGDLLLEDRLRAGYTSAVKFARDLAPRLDRKVNDVRTEISAIENNREGRHGSDTFWLHVSDLTGRPLHEYLRAPTEAELLLRLIERLEKLVDRLEGDDDQ